MTKTVVEPVKRTPDRLSVKMESGYLCITIHSIDGNRPPRSTYMDPGLIGQFMQDMTDVYINAMREETSRRLGQITTVKEGKD